MKKRLLATVLCVGMAASMLAACGGSKPAETTAAAAAETAAAEAAPAEASAETEAPAEADAGDYPNGPITAIIPYAPGGGSDVLTRALMEYMELPNGSNIVAVNVEGASGFTGAMQAANSKNDGYTILSHNPMDVVSYSLSGKTDIELWSELTNVCGLVDDFNVLVTNPNSGWTTVDEVVEYCKAHPGEVKIGNTGSGNCNMADCIRVLEALGIRDEVTIVPYDGGAANKTALMGNHIQLSLNSCADIQSGILAGDHIPLMTVGDRRAAFLPDTPCTKELGYDITTTKPRGLYAPNGMDPAQVKVLADACQKVCENEEFQKKIADLGLEVNFVPGDELKEKVGGWVEDLKPVFEQMAAEGL